MATLDQLRANRENSQRSTGPKTEEGKRRSALNGTRHGLTGRVILLPYEDMQAYNAFCKRWFNDLQPKGIHEEILVQNMADCQWVLNRAQTHIESIEACGQATFGENVNTGHPEADTAVAGGITAAKRATELDKISRYRNRWVREFNGASKQLREIQAERRDQERAQMEQAVDMYKLYRMLKKKFEPQEFGFALSNHEIERRINHKERQKEVHIAKQVGFDLEKYQKAAA